VRAAVARVGGQVVVDGLDVKPGHPMLMAALPDGRWLVGLPGNPFAACAALLTLVGPEVDYLPLPWHRAMAAAPGCPGGRRAHEVGEATVTVIGGSGEFFG
jgi:molybdopterin molybdotransferase